MCFAEISRSAAKTIEVRRSPFFVPSFLGSV